MQRNGKIGGGAPAAIQANLPGSLKVVLDAPQLIIVMCCENPIGQRSQILYLFYRAI